MFEGLFQPLHLLVIFVIAILVFGPKKLGELGKGLGEGIRSFKGAIRESNAEPTPPPALPAAENKPVERRDSSFDSVK